MITDPIQKLYECHDHIFEVVTQLHALGEAARHGGIETMLRQRHEWERVLAFMTTGAAALHTRDEEEGLFPILAKHGVVGPVDTLVTEHRTTERFTADLAGRVRRFIQAGGASQEDLDRVADDCRTLRDGYAEHIRIENEELFPQARTVIEQSEAEHLAEFMMELRNDAMASETHGFQQGAPGFVRLSADKPK